MKIIHIMQILLVCIFMPSLTMNRVCKSDANPSEVIAISGSACELSFKKMHDLFYQLPLWRRDHIEQKMSRSISFEIVRQSQDVRRQIIIKMIGEDDCQAIELFDNQPIDIVFHHYEKIKKYGVLECGNKKYGMGRLFRLSVEGDAEARDWLIALNHSPFVKLQGKSSRLVDQYDSEQKIRAMPPDMRENLSVRVISPKYMKNCYWLSSLMIGASCFLRSVSGCAPAMAFCCCIGGGCYCIHRCVVEKNSAEVSF